MMISELSDYFCIIPLIVFTTFLAVIYGISVVRMMRKDR